MNKKIIYPLTALMLTLVLLISGFIISATLNDFKDISDKANNLNKKYCQEKIYLHIDRSSYWAKEYIWFKAYLKNTVIPECNLYVELLNSEGTVVYKKTFWAQNGLAYGDFRLDDTLSSGVYQLRAYTNWMRNFEEEWFYRKNIIIWNLRDRDVSTENRDLKSHNIEFQFMPEGGTFLAGVNNKLAFKATDNKGKELYAEGIVFDEKDNEIVRFKSLHGGLGSFEFIPEANKKYKATITVAGEISLKAELPEAAVSGVAMKVTDENDKIHIQVNETGGMENDKFFIIGQNEGKVCQQAELLINSGKGIVDIDKNVFPTGIARITLFDSQMIPRCERLIFVNHHDQINVAIGTERSIYHPREEVILDIKSLANNQISEFSNLSVSVYQSETAREPEYYPENILTRFLISSELRGRIDEPGYYFKDDSVSTVMALDNLLLTHGYRYFDWKEILSDVNPNIIFQPEPAIRLKGKVTTSISGRPVKNGKVTMMSVKSQLFVKETRTDSIGNFVFSDLFFADTIQVSLQSLNKRGKPYAEIEIDKKLAGSPEAGELPVMYMYGNESSSGIETYLSELSSEQLGRRWHVTDTIMLGDVSVVARKKKVDDGYFRPYNEADFVIDVTKYDDISSNLLESLEMNSPLFRNFMIKGASFFIDGVPDFNGRVGEMPASWVEKVEFIRIAAIPGQGYGPAIYIYTKRGAPNEKTEWETGITTANIVGYSIARHFYCPDYEDPEIDKKIKNDLRNTLYWNPVVITDEDGSAQLSFFNSDLTGRINVIVEGIASDGRLCRGLCSYNVIP